MADEDTGVAQILRAASKGAFPLRGGSDPRLAAQVERQRETPDAVFPAPVS
jgi:hypothetical protein